MTLPVDNQTRGNNHRWPYAHNIGASTRKQQQQLSQARTPFMGPHNIIPYLKNE